MASFKSQTFLSFIDSNYLEAVGASTDLFQNLAFKIITWLYLDKKKKNILRKVSLFSSIEFNKYGVFAYYVSIIVISTRGALEMETTTILALMKLIHGSI